MYSISRRRVPHPCWSRSASGSHESVTSKEIKDLDKVKGVKILLSGLTIGIFYLGKGSESEEMIVTSSSFP